MEIKPNNIYCGDAYKLIKEMEDKSVDFIGTDIEEEYCEIAKRRLYGQ